MATRENRPAHLSPAARVVAFHLPQYHPVAENDEWWGKGFTEWTNVAKARPLFRGHVQPTLPGELGFYDLRLPEVRRAQADLAEEYGIEAFCYWHYWFAGRRLLQLPVEEIIRTGEPSQKFCLGWANQTWTGIWHGAPGRVLVEQTYPGAEDDRAHFDHLLPAFRDERYLTVNGCPLFYVFRPEQLPDAKVWTDRWRQMAAEAGLPGLYLVAEVSDLLGGGPVFTDVGDCGFDAGVYARLPAGTSAVDAFKMRLRRKLRGGPEVFPYAGTLPEPPAELALQSLHPCVYPNWDNTPRSARRGVVVTGAAPEKFSEHVREALRRQEHRPDQERLLFVKSWNEWAEGNHLEPDLLHGRKWLEALASAMGPRR